MKTMLLVITTSLAMRGSVAKEDEIVIESIVDQVQTGLNFVDTQTSAAADAFSLLKTVSEQTTAYIQLLGPVAAFFEIAMRTRFKLESDEMKALKLLSEQSTKQYLNIEESIKALVNNINYNVLWIEWSKEVNLPLSELNADFNALLNETGPTPTQIEEFKRRCLDLNKGPIAILNYINLRTVDECIHGCDDLPNIWVEADIILENIMIKINHWKWDESEFQSAKDHFIRNVALMGCGSRTIEIMKRVRQEMDKISEFESIRDAFEQLRKLDPYLFREINASPSCLTKAAILRGEYRRELVDNFLDAIRIRASHAAVFGFYCSNITYSGRPIDIEDYQNQITESLNKFATKTFAYTTEELDKYWPAVATRIAERHIRAFAFNRIKSFPFDLPSEIRKELNLCGYTRMFHQVTISKNYESPTKYYLAYCNPVYCEPIYQYFGFNLVLTRVDKIQLKLKSSFSKHWYQANNEKVVKIMADNYNIDSLEDLHYNISAKIDFQNNFNTIIYAREYRYSGHTTVESSTSGAWEMDFNAWQRISYNYYPPVILFWRDNEAYEMLIFI